MSIKSFMSSGENLAIVEKKSWKLGRPLIIEKGLSYYDSHPEEVAQIRENLRRIGLPDSERALNETLEHIVAHYYEKLFALVKRYEAVWICRNRVTLAPGCLEPFEEAKRDGKAVFVGQSHFGATYLLGSVLMVNGYNLNMVGKFPDPVGAMLEKSSREITERYGIGAANIINLAKPDCDAPMDMLRALIQKQIISNVFDENNEFCRSVTFCGQQIFGGSGMDMILKNFNDDRVILVTPFLRRDSDETFVYEVERHYFSSGDIIASFYNALERKVRQYPAQWYFIREFHESFIDKRSPQKMDSVR
jgi:lauroyl/myristoyl acyltransferase